LAGPGRRVTEFVPLLSAGGCHQTPQNNPPRSGCFPGRRRLSGQLTTTPLLERLILNGAGTVPISSACISQNLVFLRKKWSVLTIDTNCILVRFFMQRVGDAGQPPVCSHRASQAGFIALSWRNRRWRLVWLRCPVPDGQPGAIRRSSLADFIPT